MCPWCGGDHGLGDPCQEMTGALDRLQKESEERRNRELEEPIEWPPRHNLLREWIHCGLLCAVVRGTFSLCGYVHVPEGHPDERRGYYDVPVQVHGGLTFRCKDVNGGSWFGFDTGHGSDHIEVGDFVHEGRKWTEGDVMKETESLARQLAERGDPLGA